ncbi:MAG: winged helix-turn-helix domain-containing protein, partial [Acidimicrobiia bacterium]|nr:winged helix-turn-helix domain-containing protein [Acidimicrobiia bacterium]
FVFTTAGDAFSAAFDRAADGVAAAADAQDYLGRATWPGPELSVRIGLHVGDAELRDGDYFGPTVNVAARVAALSNGGQILLTDAAATAAHTADITDLGSHALRGVDVPMRLHQLGFSDFPPLASTEPTGARYRFDDFEIDGPAHVLRRDGEEIHIEPQVFDVLTHLVANADRLVSREELLDEVWGDQFVSLSALTSRIKTARQALGDDGKTQRYIRTVHGRGYQFVPTPTLAHDRSGHTPQAPAAVDTGDAAAAFDGSVALPHAPDPLIGRDADLTAVLEVLREGSVVTLVGPGGVGKTRLSIEVARRWADATGSTPDRSIVFIALDGVRDPSDVRSALATMLGVDVQTGSDVIQACAEWLATGDRLLIIDNCEHVLEAIAEVIGELLIRAPQLSILATSREPLHIAPERVRRLGTLPITAAGGAIDWASAPTGQDLGPAVELFVARAQRSDPSFAIDGDNVDDVVRLCTALDGLPLAVELAASRIGPLGLPELIASLGSKLDVVHALRGNADHRHHSLRSTIEWSFERLTLDAQRMLSCLARFPAGLEFSDLEQLCHLVEHDALPAEIVTQLVDTSMLIRRETALGARYNMLETVHDFAIERSVSLGLGAGGESGTDLAPESMLVEHAIRLAAGERAVWKPGDSTRSYGRIRTEIPNIRAAREVLIARGETDALISISAGLLSFTEEACLAEVWGWIDELASMTLPDDAVLRSEALAVAAAGARNRGELDEASRLAREVIDLAADDWPVGRAEHALAMASLFAGDPASAAEHWLAMDERIGTMRGHCYAALCAGYQGNIDRAWELLGVVGATLGAATPVQVEIAYYFISGEVAKIARDPAARELLERAVALATEHETWFTAGVTQVTLVSLLVEDGDVVAAAESYIELIDRWLRTGTWPQLWTTLRNVADIPGEFDDETRLTILLAAEHDAQAPVVADHHAAALQDELIDECRDRLGERADAVASSARHIPRGEVAQRAIVSLRSLIDSEADDYGS